MKHLITRTENIISKAAKRIGFRKNTEQMLVIILSGVIALEGSGTTLALGDLLLQFALGAVLIGCPTIVLAEAFGFGTEDRKDEKIPSWLAYLFFLILGYGLFSQLDIELKNREPPWVLMYATNSDRPDNPL